MGSEFEKYAKGESRDPYYELCFRLRDPLDDEFKEMAVEIFEPLLAHCKDIII